MASTTYTAEWLHTPSSEFATTRGRRVTWVLSLTIASLFMLANDQWTNSLRNESLGSSALMSEYVTTGDTARKLCILGLGICGFFMFMRRGPNQAYFRGLLGSVILLFAAWCALSVVWAETPSLTFRRVLSTGCIGMAAIGTARVLSPKQIVSMCLQGSLLIICLGFLAELSLGTFQLQAADYRFTGTAHPNPQGVRCALACLAALHLASMQPKRRLLYWALAAFAFIFLLLTKSRTAFMALVLSQGVYWAVTARARSMAVGILGITWVAALVALLFRRANEGVAEAVLMGRGDVGTANLSGRVPLWELIVPDIAHHPWLGYGFGGYWTTDRVADVSNVLSWAVPNGHSIYIDTMLQIGVPMTALIVIAIVLTIFRAYGRDRRRPLVGYGFFATVLLFGMLEGTLESFLLTRWGAYIMLTALASTVFYRIHAQDSLDSEHTRLVPQT